MWRVGSSREESGSEQLSREGGGLLPHFQSCKVIFTLRSCAPHLKASNPDILAMPDGPCENNVLCEEIHTGDRRCWEELCGELEQLSCPVLDRMRFSRPTHCEIFLPDDSAQSFLRPSPSGIQEHPCCECHCIATPRGSVTSVQSDSSGTSEVRGFWDCCAERPARKATIGFLDFSSCGLCRRGLLVSKTHCKAVVHGGSVPLSSSFCC